MINTFSAVILKGLLSSGEWYETPGQLYRAGQILEEVIPEIPAEPSLTQQATQAEIDAYPARHRAWAVTPVAFLREPTPREREVIARCVKWAAEKKILRGSIHLLPLLNLAGLKPEE